MLLKVDIEVEVALVRATVKEDEVAAVEAEVEEKVVEAEVVGVEAREPRATRKEEPRRLRQPQPLLRMLDLDAVPTFSFLTKVPRYDTT